ncbi:hypothetical protein GGR56DRAFT_468019 [Xylariaceae sp. FL0804]|nr:hypothetical protein GGR56DRAFT_468019 [Xylariaceae sp. FL0804]
MASLLPLLVAAVWLPVRGVDASFNLYPTLDQDRLAIALNVTSACVAALNQTIPECDQTLLGMAQQLENYWWTDDNVTSLCDPDTTTNTSCSDAVTAWNGASAAACDEQYYAAYGALVPAWSITERLRDNLAFACLESWSDDYSWCLTESQEWVGADVLRADCDTNPDDPTCSGDASAIPEANIRMANLYSDDILCNNCFVNQLYARVTSPFLPDADHSDYLVDQLFDIQDICNVTLPEFTVRLLDYYDAAPPLTSTDFGTGATTTTTTTSAPAATTTCAGQSITESSGKTCDTLSTTYGVSTGSLRYFSNSDTCDTSAGACLPAACQLRQIESDETCASVAASIGDNNSTTLAQFMGWNPYVLGLCDSLTEGQYVCVSSPGSNGTWTLPDPPLGTDADAGNQQRGGAGGVVTPTTTVTTTVNPVSGGITGAPSPTQDGLVSNCNNYASATNDQGCEAFATLNSIAPKSLYLWNPVLGLSGEDCTTALWASEYYCIGTSEATATATHVTAPGPTQSGIAANCDEYATPEKDQGCYDFAAANDITSAQLYSWNPVLGDDGENCGTLLETGEYYCVGTAVAATTTAHVTAPGPTQTGLAANCVKYATPEKDQGCEDLATDNGVTYADFYTWNPVLGPNGENCGTLLETGEYYCVGVSS